MESDSNLRALEPQTSPVVRRDALYFIMEQLEWRSMYSRFLGLCFVLFIKSILIKRVLIFTCLLSIFLACVSSFL